MASSSTSSDDNIDKRRAICTELDELRHNLRDIDSRMREIMARGSVDQLFVIMNVRTAYLKIEGELHQDEQIYP